MDCPHHLGQPVKICQAAGNSGKRWLSFTVEVERPM